MKRSQTQRMVQVPTTYPSCVKYNLTYNSYISIIIINNTLLLMEVQDGSGKETVGNPDEAEYGSAGQSSV
jgi:hypothetical protein